MLKTFQLIMIVVMVATLAACGNLNRQPRYDVDREYQIQTFKRFSKWSHKNQFHRIKTKAYSKVTEPIVRRLSDTQTAVLERHGQPDYIRHRWKATTGEIVDEWAWWDRKVVCQFVQRELVWEGPLTDMDAYRIRYGIPYHSTTQVFEQGVRRDLWDYQGVFNGVKGRMVTFSDERLVSMHNY